MKERRHNTRLKIDINVLIFVDGIENDIAGEVADISEESIGIHFKIPAGYEEIIKEQHSVKIQFIDTYKNGRSTRTDVIQATAMIKRMDIVEDTCFLGCVIWDEGFRKYAVRRMMEKYY